LAGDHVFHVARDEKNRSIRQCRLEKPSGKRHLLLLRWNRMDTLKSSAERDMIRRWVDTWRIAGDELEAIRRHDAEAVSTHEALRQLFEGTDALLTAPAPRTSGLVEQQMWFSRIRAGAESRKPESR
jgi:hypothetical protein